MVRKQKFGYYYYNEVEKDYVKNCNKETKNMYQILTQNFVERIDPCSILFFSWWLVSYPTFTAMDLVLLAMRVADLGGRKGKACQ